MSRQIKRKRGSAALAVISIVLIIGLSVFSVSQVLRAGALSKDLEQTQADSEQIKTDLAALQSQNDTLKSDNDSLKSQLQSLQDAYSELENQSSASQTSVQDDTAGSDTDNGNSGEKVAYLTFDDGPSKVTSDLLSVLDDLDVKATFFVSFAGSDSAEKRALLKQESDAGHVVGVHTWTHDYYTIYANEENFLEDFNKMKEVITESTGKTPNVCRFPGGASNTVSITASGGEIIMPQLAELVQDMGFQFFDWNAGGYDAEKPYPTASELASKVINDAEGRDTVVILLHDTHDFTVDAVPEIVNELRSQGYTFKTLTPDSPAVQQAFAQGKNS
jgi:peptidoglycan/xylan/chitin deacetylase (PgdA/CDA1 family)